MCIIKHKLVETTWTLVPQMDDRYRSINQPDMQFSVQLAGFFIAQSLQKAPLTEKHKVDSETVDAYGCLDEFQRWIRENNESVARIIPNFDSAALFTKF